VWLGTDWAAYLDAWLGPSLTLNRLTQVLVLAPDEAEAERAAARLRDHTGPWAVAVSMDMPGLTPDVIFAGKRRVEEVSPRLRVLHHQGQVWLAGGPDQQPGAAGLVWVQVCPGTFTMGTLSKEEDAMAYEDEILPEPRTVVLSAFQIAQTETTQQQAGQTGNLPMVSVNWAQARAVCQQLGGDLPTEAQWEYAARAGSRFPWSFGADAARLGDYAWFAENAKTAQAVRQKLPNPLGLYDMYGNVWEWTRDWYGAYVSGVWVDPLGPSSGECTILQKDTVCRVVRGGSFASPPEALRSARRVWFEPERQADLLGFRCVRVPPQP
jgi:formylglycine-generating enzyme required for sulfatase activity